MNEATRTTSTQTVKIGLFGIGLETYWRQFDGLLPRLQGYQQQIADRIGQSEV